MELAVNIPPGPKIPPEFRSLPMPTLYPILLYKGLAKCLLEIR